MENTEKYRNYKGGETDEQLTVIIFSSKATRIAVHTCEYFKCFKGTADIIEG